MFFKNLTVFKLTELFEQTPEQLSDKLWGMTFKPCGLHDESSCGFVPSLGNDAPLVHAANGYIMFCVKTQKKVLPSSAVNDLVAEKVKRTEIEENRKLSKKERVAIKDEIIFELLPKALCISKLTYAYIDVKGGFIVIDTSSSGVAEDLLSLLRKCLGSLACVPLNVKNNPSTEITNWVYNSIECPDLLHVESDAVLKSIDEDKSVIRCKNQDLFHTEVQGHLDAGKQITSLALTYDDRLSFTLDDTLVVKKLKFLDAVHADLSHDDIETPEQRFDADFAIMTGELTVFISAMIGWFGGLVEVNHE